MRANETAELCVGAIARKEALVFFEALIAALHSVAVADFVAEHTAEPDIAHRFLNKIERAGDGIRRGMMIDERRRAESRRLDGADERAIIDRLLVERAIEFPPDALEEFGERFWLRARAGHSADKRRIQMRVRVDHARHDDPAVKIDDCFSRYDREALARCNNTIAGNPQVFPLH